MTAPTLSQTIIHSIAEDIVSGKLSPGHKLDELGLAKRFSVSRTPIREALRELAATRLIAYVPRNGFTVAPLDAAQLDDLFEAAGEMESLCAGLCAMRARMIDRTEIDRIHKQSMKATRDDPKTYAALNEQLHNAIYIGCRNRTIETMALDIRRRLAPFRSRQFYSKDRVRSSMQEHEEIVSAILAFDRDKAAAAMRRHISGAALNVIQYFTRKSG
ncbi:MAG: GntR family transcriptional regulator [Pseudolabrys sp.]|nr:GntR family transcriptional regulator [Pseudolabrys sp.]MCW5683100.1 GntR family transcriptional regulator [Pseudolabrys sp.]